MERCEHTSAGDTVGADAVDHALTAADQSAPDRFTHRMDARNSDR